MNGSRKILLFCSLVLPLLVAPAAPAAADVKTREKSQVKFEGMLGTMANMFGGKAAREGVVFTNAVKGNRKAVLNDTTGRIVDLGEEKVYELDMKRKTFEVITFEELRRRMREAQQKAQENAKRQPDAQEPGQKEPGREVEIDFDVKETGQKRTIAGYDARQVIMTIAVREKGRTLEEGGGLVVTSDSWLGPQIPGMQEMAEFEMKYWKAIAPEASGISAEQMAAVYALYPMIRQAMDRLSRESTRLEGTPLATTLTFEGVKSKEQLSQQQNQGGGGLSGMLARRIAKRDDKPRATIFTSTNETLEIATTVPQADLEIPAGFKEKK
ncbi:MAG TPA: hypothetical protein VD833_24220 [Vicinamibacterales bacterium]|nr:hypothetical protein [Vicinamibacterales bacterium]